MPTNVNKVIAALPRGRRNKIKTRAKMLIAEELTRQQLRQLRSRTQVQVAQTLGITQDSVSRLEQRADILVSTLRKYIQAMGGDLSIVAEFPDRAPVKLAGLSNENEAPARAPRSRRRAKVFT